MPTTVLVGEKPKVASRIAQALGDYSIDENRGVKNYVIDTDEGKLIIAPAVGHIFNLDQIEEGWDYPVFDVEWKPTFETSDSADYMKKYYNNLRDQLEKADNYVNACDFDLEGCLQYEENVVVKQDNEISIVRAGELIDSILQHQEVKKDEEFEYVECEDLEIVGMNDWNTEFCSIEKVMRRPSDKKYLEITTFNGRKVKVSKNHPMLVATYKGLESKHAEDLEVGDQVLNTKSTPHNSTKEELDLIDELDEIYVHGFKEEMKIMPAEMCKHVEKTRKQCVNYRYHDRMPKNIFLELEDNLGVERSDLTVSSYKGSTRLPAKLKLDRKLGRFIGLYLAEGCIDSGGFIGLYFGPEEDELVKEVREFLNFIGTEGRIRKRNVKGSYGDSECFEVGTKSRILRMLLKNLDVGEASGEKKLPTWILSTPEAFKKGLISGYWDGDGSIFIDRKDDRAIASAGSKSSKLLEDFFYLLQSYTVNPSFQSWNHSDREMTNLTIARSQDLARISSKLNFSDEIQQKVEEVSKNTRYNLGGLPTCLARRQKVKTEKKGQLNAAETISRTHVLEWEEEMEKYPDGDATFLKVKKIQEKNSEKDYFYDFQTSSRNFMHGNGIISHNSVIGYNVIKHITDADEDDIRRMKFSTLTQGDLQNAFDDLEDFDRGMTEAGITRHVLDYYYGINVSRALMKAVRKADRYKTLSTGRVQGPALKILADREREIQAFEPDPYWEIYLKHSEFDAQWEDDEDRIWDEDTAEKVFKEVKDAKETVVTNVKVNNYKHNVPIPFNLTGLQSEASSQFRISPKKTQQIAQTLYENGLISYPRTESQKLPAKLGYKSLLNKLKGQKEYQDIAKKVLDKNKLSPRQGKKKDDAHPAIYPTGEHPSNLSKQERKVYDLIVKRFFAVFGKAAKRQSLTFTLEVNGHDFKAKSKITKERNWYDLYEPYVRVDEADLPDMEEGQTLDIEEFEIVEKETQPPNRYSQSGIVNKLEKKDLGTKATRASTIDRLYSRNYIEEEPIEVTPLGLTIVSTLEDHCGEIVSEELTREFEEKMDSIQEEKDTREEVLEEAEKHLGDILGKFKEQELEIGKELVETIDADRERRRQLGACQKCEEEDREDGTLRIIKTKQGRFVGCSNYPDCENSFPLPRNGDIKATNEVCEECGTPKIWVNRKKGKNYNMCIDPDCPTKDDW